MGSTQREYSHNMRVGSIRHISRDGAAPLGSVMRSLFPRRASSSSLPRRSLLPPRAPPLPRLPPSSTLSETKNGGHLRAGPPPSPRVGAAALPLLPPLVPLPAAAPSPPTWAAVCAPAALQLAAPRPRRQWHLVPHLGRRPCPRWAAACGAQGRRGRRPCKDRCVTIYSSPPCSS